MVEKVWRDLLFLTHATSVGAITSLALAAIDTALWDLRCRKAGLPLHVMAGGARDKVGLYTTEGGWLHLPTEALVADALEAKRKGFGGSKIKVGRSPHEDVARLAESERPLGPTSKSSPTPIRPLPSTRRSGARDSTRQPISAGSRSRCRRTTSRATRAFRAQRPFRSRSAKASISPSQVRDYLQRGACSIVQVDVRGSAA